MLGCTTYATIYAIFQRYGSEAKHMSTFSQSLHRYFEAHEDEHLKELIEFLRIPSISTLEEHHKDINAACSWLINKLTIAGLENVQAIETDGYPFVYADWLHAPGKPTVLIYGHYDVQPVDPVELWESPPFSPVVQDDKIYARGATDDKGQVFLHIKAIEALLALTGELPINIKCCIEGEEEVGSFGLTKWLENNQEILATDFIVISDTSLMQQGVPAICYAVRGLCALQIDVQGPQMDLHSGGYGGAVSNPIHALAKIIQSFHDESGKIAIEGFYDDVVHIDVEERNQFSTVAPPDEYLMNQLGVPHLYGEPGYTAIERTWIRPAIDTNGIYGGFSGEGTKTIIPSSAHAKVSIRLVPDQKPTQVFEQLEAHIQLHAMPGVIVTTTRVDEGLPYVASLDHIAVQAAHYAYQEAYQVEPVYIRMGGSIPIVSTFSEQLNAPIILMGFGLPDEQAHAPNEHFHLDNFRKGLLTLALFFTQLTQ